MFEYPSILSWNEIVKGKPCIAFDKLDGNNIRYGWTRKKGFHKFGTRRNRIDENNEMYGEAITLFMDKYSKGLEKEFKRNKRYRSYGEFIVFCEYYGLNSFAGQHDPRDKKDVVLFDVYIPKVGFVKPKDFIKDFGHLGIPEVIYEGNLNQDFINDVKEGKYAVREGVVCKGVHNNKLWMGKIKTNDWLEEVKAMYGQESLKELGE